MSEIPWWAKYKIIISVFGWPLSMVQFQQSTEQWHRNCSTLYYVYIVLRYIMFAHPIWLFVLIVLRYIMFAHPIWLQLGVRSDYNPPPQHSPLQGWGKSDGSRRSLWADWEDTYPPSGLKSSLKPCHQVACITGIRNYSGLWHIRWKNYPDIILDGKADRRTSITVLHRGVGPSKCNLTPKNVPLRLRVHFFFLSFLEFLKYKVWFFPVHYTKWQLSYMLMNGFILVLILTMHLLKNTLNKELIKKMTKKQSGEKEPWGCPNAVMSMKNSESGLLVFFR